MTTIASPLFPNVRGHGQCIDLLPILSCFYCEECDHISSCSHKLSSATSSATSTNADIIAYVMFTS